MHINAVKIHPERMMEKDKKLVNDLNYHGIKFPVLENDFSKIETKKTFASMFFVKKINQPFQFTFQVKNLKIQWIYCLCMMGINHMCRWKIFTDLCFTNQKIKTKNTIAKVVYSAIVVKMF